MNPAKDEVLDMTIVVKEGLDLRRQAEVWNSGGALEVA